MEFEYKEILASSKTFHIVIAYHTLCVLAHINSYGECFYKYICIYIYMVFVYIFVYIWYMYIWYVNSN